MIARFRSDGAIRDFVVNFRSKNGRVHTLLLNADVVELGGEPCMLNVGIDITERRRRDQVQAATYEISQLVVSGGDLTALFADVHRIIAGLMPILWSHGAGADVMKRIATPMIGGVVTSTIMELLVYPAIFFLWRQRGLSGGSKSLPRSTPEALAP